MFGRVLNMPRAQNIPSFEDAKVTEGYARNVPEYAHLRLNMPEYV